MPSIQTNYRGAMLRLSIDDDLTARLFINNIQRMSEQAAGYPSRIRLSSTVQTDYEWHEFIEGLVEMTDSGTILSLSANNEAVCSESFDSDNPNG